VKVLLNIQGTAEETKNKHLKPQSSSKKTVQKFARKP